ncbi:hypothetical protein DPMN_021144 [Dreissena polymorpha]|uniref:Uncharacterized protein n=1 Tax=Dreissena polymorpha TaxID=45954 RepID=A0A9D4NK84_DREPO|nr:hypothetical protein DPMN_021144 [Dreissena polymorpha]
MGINWNARQDAPNVLVVFEGTRRLYSLGKYVYSHQSTVHKRAYKLVLPSIHYTDLSLVPNHEAKECQRIAGYIQTAAF